MASAAEKHVAFVGAYIMPDVTPAALRATGLARAAVEAGWNAEIIAAEVDEGGLWLPRASLRKFHGIPTVSAAEYGGPRSTRASRFLGGWVTFGQGIRRALETRGGVPLRAVISMGGYAPATLQLLPWSRRTRVPLVVDVVDWFDPKHCVGGRYGLVRLQVELALRVLYKRAAGIIAIGSWLERYYLAAGCRVIRVPPTLDVNESKWERARRVPFGTTDVLRLGYAGTPGKKDDVALVLEAVRRVRDLGRRVELRVIGPSREQVLAQSRRVQDDVAALGYAVHFTGRQKHADVPAILAESSFSILMRPDARYAHAGFPTKVVESLAAGVPVIANLTSDIGEVIRDGVDGLHVTSYSPDSLTEALIRACDLGTERRQAMRLSAAQRARELFHYTVHAERLTEFLAALG